MRCDVRAALDAAARIARAISWWPMVFQDVLRLNFDRVEGMEFARAAQYHRDEDGVHDRRDKSRTHTRE